MSHHQLFKSTLTKLMAEFFHSFVMLISEATKHLVGSGPSLGIPFAGMSPRLKETMKRA